MQGMGRGKGRGRGLSNLPAWLVKKQQKESLAKDVEGLASSNEPFRQVKPKMCLSNVVILSNIVAPGDVDDELADEVKEECEKSSGPVISIKVKQAEEKNPVRVFVYFESNDDASKAASLFNGRMFGGRKISAVQSEAKNAEE